MGDALLGPEPAHQRDLLGQAWRALAHRYAEGGELGFPVAKADAERVAAARKQIHRRRFLGDHHRVQQRQDADVGADHHALGLAQQPGHQRHGLGHLHRPDQVMVGEPERGEAGAAREAHLLDQLGQPGGKAVAFRELGVQEQAHLHGWYPPAWWRQGTRCAARPSGASRI